MYLVAIISAHQSCVRINDSLKLVLKNKTKNKKTKKKNINLIYIIYLHKGQGTACLAVT